MAERTRQRPSSPKPWRQFEARTTFLRVPADDWAKVKNGNKTEFRAAGGHSITQLWNVTCPIPVVAWVARRNERYESALMVLEATWQELVGAITPESLAAEGFPSVAHFRRYWMERTKQRFRPLQKVQVYRVRPMAPDDEVILGRQLFRKLYAEHLPDDPR